ncbi:lysosomal Pro-X carboxypeptidase [Danaus plexippus]|uniref:Lysosomal Pro-X carboxypeptidase n=1 Tax=Danaus plexippus plexippus TaxID=278856 RepID=A0A212ELM2_DANPL|nr:lysosomal Pro-X carboxypeptidase [Danaus plexippus]OWR42386.1 Prolylcarboxypeptidase [Danaus plexippus plexippus]
MFRVISLVLFINYVTCDYKFETKWFNVPLDHFGFQRNETFNIKYLINEEYWDKGGGPIFFYTGNEGQIEVFAKHTGFMWDIAEEFKAKLVFAEHRYYGQSMPFGNKSLDNEHIGYLTSEQALADYADLINYLQGNKQRPTYPVIAFGGSYGGMLSAYIRIKYPHLVTGAIAASAPIHMYPGMVPCEVFHRIVTSSFKIADEKCVKNIRSSWGVLRKFLESQNNTDWLHKNWNLCEPVKPADVNTLMEFLQSMYETLAMVNYPFPSDFLLPLPAQPVRVVCQYLNETLSGQKLIEAIGKVIKVYSNYDGKAPCVDYKKGDDFGNLDASGWDYQACTEMIMPMCTTGNQDMFEPSPWNFTKYAEDCHRKYNVYPRQEAARIQYGGDRLRAATNIVFSNGLLDPWAGGGILNSISNSVKAVVIIDAAHHLDLMPSNPADPNSVKLARNIHKQNIDKWIREFRTERSDRHH